MSALLPPPPVNDLEAADQYLVSYGKSGAVGVFLATGPLPLRRGTPVILQTPRGTERGTVLGPATLRQARLLGATASGTLLRRATAEDETRYAELARQADVIFETSRAQARQDGLAIELLDVEVLLDGRQAILQYVGTDTALDAFAQALERHFPYAIRLEDLAAAPAEDHAGCGKPDCGRDAGGCTSCSTGGGCSS